MPENVDPNGTFILEKLLRSLKNDNEKNKKTKKEEKWEWKKYDMKFKGWKVHRQMTTKWNVSQGKLNKNTKWKGHKHFWYYFGHFNFFTPQENLSKANFYPNFPYC